MGSNLIDQYSLLHFATGIIFYFFGISIKNSIILHTLFELIENSPAGMAVITQFTFWPGGKKKADSITNSIGDTFFFIIGWYIAKKINDYFILNDLYKI